jgi:hypothetical protein
VNGVGRQKPGVKPVESVKHAEWLYDFLAARGDDRALLGDIISAAGAAGMIGEQREVDGKRKWSGLNALYRAKDRVIELPDPPRAKKRVNDEKEGNRKVWKLCDALELF